MHTIVILCNALHKEASSFKNWFVTKKELLLAKKNPYCWLSHMSWWDYIQKQAGQRGFIEHRPPKKTTEYRPNIDHTALYRPNIDRKIYLKLLKKRAFTLFTKSWDIHILGKWGIKEDHFNWGHLGKHCIWTTLHYADPKGITAVIILGFWWNIDHFDVISTENLRISTI